MKGGRSGGRLAGLLLPLAACAPTDLPVFEYDLLDDADTELDPLCEEDFSVCGDILVPSPLDGEPRMIAVALYRNIPPAGPPFYTVLEEEQPVLAAGGRYKVRVRPVLETGDFYIWSNLYMEGGGRFIPSNGIDFVGNLDEPIPFDGSPVLFDDFRLEIASGW
jgi:hypothetical protein